MSNIKATWHISLDCECPKCKVDIDLESIDDGVLGYVQVGEHDTKASTNYEVECPHCGHEFLVDFEY